MTAASLQSGDEFKISAAHKGFKTVTQIIIIKKNARCPASFIGSLLIITSDNLVLVMKPKQKIIIKQKQAMTTDCEIMLIDDAKEEINFKKIFKACTPTQK